MFSIESVINTQYPSLAGKNKKLLRPVISFSRTLFHEPEMQQFEQRYQHLKGIDVVGHTVPTLYKQYTEVCEPEGVIFSDFNIDPDFSDCVDGFVIVDIDKLNPKKRKRYIEHEETPETR